MNDISVRASTTDDGLGVWIAQKNHFNLLLAFALQVRKEKLGDRITALQQLVSPFGKVLVLSALRQFPLTPLAVLVISCANKRC